MTRSFRRLSLCACLTIVGVLSAVDARAVVVDTTTQGNWIQGGSHVYGGDGYILMNFKAVVTGEYVASGNTDGSLSDLVSLPAYVSSYSYKSTGAIGWYGNNGPGNVDNVNPVAGLQSPLDPNNPAASKQVGAYPYVDGPGTSTIDLILGADVPESFTLGLYGSSIGRPGQAVNYSVLGETALLEGDEYNDGIWALFTIENATPGSTLTIDVAPLGNYAFISALTFDSVLVPEPSSIAMSVIGGVGLLLAARRRVRKSDR